MFKSILFLIKVSFTPYGDLGDTHHFSWKEAAKAYEFLVEDRTRALGVILNWV